MEESHNNPSCFERYSIFLFYYVPITALLITQVPYGIFILLIYTMLDERSFSRIISDKLKKYYGGDDDVKNNIFTEIIRVMRGSFYLLLLTIISAIYDNYGKSITTTGKEVNPFTWSNVGNSLLATPSSPNSWNWKFSSEVRGTLKNTITLEQHKISNGMNFSVFDDAGNVISSVYGSKGENMCEYFIRDNQENVLYRVVYFPSGVVSLNGITYTTLILDSQKNIVLYIDSNKNSFKNSQGTSVISFDNYFKISALSNDADVFSPTYTLVVLGMNYYFDNYQIDGSNKFYSSVENIRYIVVYFLFLLPFLEKLFMYSYLRPLTKYIMNRDSEYIMLKYVIPEEKNVLTSVVEIVPQDETPQNVVTNYN